MQPETDPSWASCVRGRWRWQAHPAWLCLLDAGSGPDWLNLQENPQAAKVKANDGREVWRVDLPQTQLFVKIGRPDRRWARWRQWLRGSNALREKRVADYAAEHEIDAVRPIAIADAPIQGRRPTSLLVTLGLPSARPLNDYWESLDPAAPGTRQKKNEVIEAVARLVARAHQNGFEHFDLHAGNMLIEPTGTGLRALFVDLNNIRIGRPVRDTGVVRNLAQINQWFRTHAPITDRVRFLFRYLHWRRQCRPRSSHGRSLDCDAKELLRRLDVEALRHAMTLYAKRDRRIMRTGRYFARIDLGGGWRGHVFLVSKHPVEGSPASSMTFTPQQWKQWLRDPLLLVTPTDHRLVVKESHSGMVCRGRLGLDADRSLEIICKRWMPRTWWKRVLHLFRASRPMQTWKRGNALLHRQIPTARPLAVLERRRFGLLLDSLIVTEYLPHTQDLDTLLTVALRQLPDPIRRTLKRQISASLSRVIHRLYDRGFTHRDLKAPNVLVQWNHAANEPPRVLLVDLDGLHPVRHPSPQSKCEALARLNVSLDHCKRVTLTDRARFLRTHLIRPGHPDPLWRLLWSVIAAGSESKRRSRQRRQEKMLRKYGRF
ncbi:MAG TPA: lipopolysaccharide kinase InaA family protein [Phycisphaerae bacterium]|nr:lipopolysaccharide kinase InaA family protein [Phycisphaerae bacterium]